MKLSAIMFALILNAFQATAHAESLVVAAGDEYASKSETPVASTGEYGPVLAETAAKQDASAEEASKTDRKEFDRLLGQVAAPKALSTAEQKTVDSVANVALPWWSWPLGLLAFGVLLIARSKANKQQVPLEAIHVVSRQPMGKDGSLALIEVQDGDSRPRRLLVGLGGGSPRLVADISAWEVAVAAPSNISNDALAIVGPDPMENTADQVEERRAQLHVAPNSFSTQLSQAAARYGEQESSESTSSAEALSKADLIEDVLAKRDMVRLETVGDIESSRKGRNARKPSYSSREILV
jgi:flagellar biogenesis protein FliO